MRQHGTGQAAVRREPRGGGALHQAVFIDKGHGVIVPSPHFYIREGHAILCPLGIDGSTGIEGDLSEALRERRINIPASKGVAFPGGYVVLELDGSALDGGDGFQRRAAIGHKAKGILGGGAGTAGRGLALQIFHGCRQLLHHGIDGCIGGVCGVCHQGFCLFHHILKGFIGSGGIVGGIQLFNGRQQLIELGEVTTALEGIVCLVQQCLSCRLNGGKIVAVKHICYVLIGIRSGKGCPGVRRIFRLVVAIL